MQWVEGEGSYYPSIRVRRVPQRLGASRQFLVCIAIVSDGPMRAGRAPVLVPVASRVCAMVHRRQMLCWCDKPP